ncbi:DUF1499 domain-containing protein [Roseovarius salis]|uniref:DUF1499 domain-containing protein n=1 Tax=Roseovarius salis TaxID=3376063 RepID=UPI0037C63426
MKPVLRMALIVVLLILIGLGLYVRFAPTDPSRWHQMPEQIENRDMARGAMRVVTAGEGHMARLHDIITGTPRTRVLAGGVEQGMVTYVTRSLVFGFPDYTTVRKTDGTLEIHARLRFGSSDMGVNAARVDRWLQAFAEGR